MVTCRGCCSSIVIVLLLVACTVTFILHSLYYVLPFMDNVGTKESIKRISSVSQRVPTIIICNRMPFSIDGINAVSSGINNDNTKRYLREWTNAAARDYPEYTSPTSGQNTDAYNSLNSALPQSARKQRLQQMLYQCQSVVNSCSFNGNAMSAYQCCQAVSIFVPTMNGLCWTYYDTTVLVTQNTTLPQIIITFTISRNSWYTTDMPTHPGIDIYLRESADDVIRLASDLETPPKVTIKDKQGVRLRVKRQNRIDSRRHECGTNTETAAATDNNARANNRANMMFCVIMAAMNACNCHPLLAETINYNTNTTYASQFSSRVNATVVCTLDQYDQCARRYVETARVQNRGEPLPSDLSGLNELQYCRSNNAFPCLDVAYSADPEPFALPALYTTSQDYVSRLTIDFASLATFEVLKERAIPLFEMLSNVGYNIALWFAVGHIIWTVFTQARDVCCKPTRVAQQQQSVIGSRLLAPEQSKLATPESFPAAPLATPLQPAQSLVTDTAPIFTIPSPPARSPSLPNSAAPSARAVHFTPPSATETIPNSTTLTHPPHANPESSSALPSTSSAQRKLSGERSVSIDLDDDSKQR